jgi:hypothetical protein
MGELMKLLAASFGASFLLMSLAVELAHEIAKPLPGPCSVLDMRRCQ